MWTDDEDYRTHYKCEYEVADVHLFLKKNTVNAEQSLALPEPVTPEARLQCTGLKKLSLYTILHLTRLLWGFTIYLFL